MLLCRFIGLQLCIVYSLFVDGLQVQHATFYNKMTTPLKSHRQRLLEKQNDAPPIDSFRRHLLLTGIGSAIGWMLQTPPIAMAADVEEEITNTVILKGTVILDEDTMAISSSEKNALYVTCRPDKPDNVPGAILNGSRGKPPPVMAARFENPAFPFDFELSSPKDLTIEGASDGSSSNTAPVLDPSKFWWNKDDLIVSARWDSDGVAATRSPDDLVGRSIRKRSGDEDATVKVTLGGRGAFGKFATGGSKK